MRCSRCEFVYSAEFLPNIVGNTDSMLLTELTGGHCSYFDHMNVSYNPIDTESSFPDLSVDIGTSTIP